MQVLKYYNISKQKGIPIKRDPFFELHRGRQLYLIKVLRAPHQATWLT